MSEKRAGNCGSVAPFACRYVSHVVANDDREERITSIRRDEACGRRLLKRCVVRVVYTCVRRRVSIRLIAMIRR